MFFFLHPILPISNILALIQQAITIIELTLWFIFIYTNEDEWVDITLRDTTKLDQGCQSITNDVGLITGQYITAFILS